VECIYHLKISLSCLLRLFSFNFCVCDVKNTVRYLIIHQTVFYTMGSIKKLNLKRSFCEVVFTCFLNWVS
jgi:hypothetical protein